MNTAAVAVPVARRARWTLLALLPGALALAWFDTRPDVPILVAIGALVLQAMSGESRPQRWMWIADFALAYTWLVVAAAPPAALVLALAIVAVIHWAFGKDPAMPPFHPAMLASALGLLAVPPAAASAVPAEPAWSAAAFAAGGLALLAARCIRWQTPVGMLATLAASAAIAGLFGNPTLADSRVQAIFPLLALLAFFVIDDPPRTAMQPIARLACGAFAGLLSAGAILALHAIHRESALPFALAGAVLLMNAAAPGMDAFVLRDRPGRHRDR